jgi:site-specific DNA-methyltransferase (adenine-specific)
MRKIAARPEPSVARKFSERDAALASNPAILKTLHSMYLGDAREMRELVQGKPPIDLVVTSPPYWTLKEYDGSAGDAQLGHWKDYESFQEQLALVWKRCFDLLTPGGRLCVVVGDVCLPRRKGGRHLVVPLHADITVHCRRIGFDYLTPILWHKIANAVTEVEGNGSPFLGKPYEPNAIIKNDIEYVLLFRKPGGYRNPTPEQRMLSLIDKADHAKWFRSIWLDLPGASTRKGHPAPFPTDLAYRLIRMFSFVGDTVLDPFIGTGSTTDAAIRAFRNSVGYEIEPTYFRMLRERFAQVTTGVEVQFRHE